MRPEFIDAMSWEMAEVYGAVTDQILINLAKYFPYYDSSTFPRSSLTYQADMLAQMGQVNKETMAIIRRNLKNADPVLQRSLEQIIIDSVEAVNPELWDAVKKGIFMPPMTTVVSANQYRAFNLYYKQAADKLNLVNTVMLESTQDAYMATVSDIANRIQATQTALDIGAGETITGASAWNTATAHAINRMKQNGITGFIDHAGRRWSAESYVAMDIRTTMFNTGRAAVWETNQNFGNDLYQVSYHNGARPLCYPWQNKVISSTDTARTVTDLDGNEIEVIAQSATSYGKAAGLFGVNCKHYPNPFIPGVSVIRGEPQDKKTNDRVYEESQQQRAYERKIREEKRDLMMLKAQGAPDDIIKAQRAKIRQTDDDIDEFCAKTGRHRRQNREGVYTERKFPSAFTYDPRLFEEKQQQLIDDYFKSGGAQQGFTFGQMTPKAPPITPPPITPPATPAPVASKNVAPKATKAKPKTDKMKQGGLDAKNFPDTFNKKKTKTFVDTVNATEGTDPDVVKLFNTMGAQVKGQSYPITISYTEENHAVGDAVYVSSGKRAEIRVKVPKLADAEYIQTEVGTTAHEWGHLFDHINSERGVLSYKFDNGALPNALQNARPMSERIKKLIEDAVKDGLAAEKAAMDAIKADIDAINDEISNALKARDYSEYTRLSKLRDKLWKDSARTASKASRKAHNGRNAIEDIYDAISGGTLRDKTRGMYGHGSKYYRNNPGGENASAETIANYCSLALAYPDLFELMAEEQPEIWEACGNIVKAMIGE